MKQKSLPENSPLMLNSFAISFIVFLFIQTTYGYAITIKEKLFGIVDVYTKFDKVKLIELDEGNVNIEAII